MRKGFQICEEMRQYLVIYEEPISNMRICITPSEIFLFLTKNLQRKYSHGIESNRFIVIFLGHFKIHTSRPRLKYINSVHTTVKQMVRVLRDSFAQCRSSSFLHYIFINYMLLFRNVVVGSSTTSSRLGPARPPSQNGRFGSLTN
jgi:hypothetical protein